MAHVGHRSCVADGNVAILPPAAAGGDLRTAAAPAVTNVATAIHEAPAIVHKAAAAAAAVHKATTATHTITHLHTLCISKFDHQRHFRALRAMHVKVANNQFEVMPVNQPPWILAWCPTKQLPIPFLISSRKSHLRGIHHSPPHRQITIPASVPPPSCHQHAYMHPLFTQAAHAGSSCLTNEE